MRNFGFAEVTITRKNPNTFGFFLVFSYLCTRFQITLIISNQNSACNPYTISVSKLPCSTLTGWSSIQNRSTLFSGENSADAIIQRSPDWNTASKDRRLRKSLTLISRVIYWRNRGRLPND